VERPGHDLANRSDVAYSAGRGSSRGGKLPMPVGEVFELIRREPRTALFPIRRASKHAYIHVCMLADKQTNKLADKQTCRHANLTTA